MVPGISLTNFGIDRLLVFSIPSQSSAQARKSKAHSIGNAKRTLELRAKSTTAANESAFYFQCIE